MLALGAGSLSYLSTIVLALSLSTGSIFAADRGDPCCGDLGDRIAELEATTAIKGNRKMSLTIAGQVNRIIMWWDDGRSSNTYYDIDSASFSSRFAHGQGSHHTKSQCRFPAHDR